MDAPTKILVIDDEPDFSALLKDNLEESGNYLVVTEEDPERALERAREFEPDLIFVDVVMPKMDGGDVVSALKEDPVVGGTPVLMLTALVEEDPRQPTGESVSGGLVFVSKTTSLENILALIERSVEGRDGGEGD